MMREPAPEVKAMVATENRDHGGVEGKILGWHRLPGNIMVALVEYEMENLTSRRVVVETPKANHITHHSLVASIDFGDLG